MKFFRLTPKARDDLADIWDRTMADWGAQQAESYVRQIEAALERHAANPGFAPNADTIRPGYRRFRVGSHVVFFKEGAEGIEVVRILHGHMDYTRHL